MVISKFLSALFVAAVLTAPSGVRAQTIPPPPPGIALTERPMAPASDGKAVQEAKEPSKTMKKTAKKTVKKRKKTVKKTVKKPKKKAI